MSVAIIAAGTARDIDFDAYKLRPEFRKATLNMILAAASQDQAFAGIGHTLTQENLSSAAMVFGSSYGELGTTISFLDYLSQSGVARPLLFQNSLHSATLGFLAIRLKLTGPSVTASNSYYTAEDCIELATTLLKEMDLSFCVVTAVDSFVTQLKIDAEENIGSKGEGAATLVLSSKEKAEKMGWPVLAYLKGIRRTSSSLEGLSGSFVVDTNSQTYHSDMIEKLALQLRSNSGRPESLWLKKMDGNHTVVELEWLSC